MDTHRLVPPRRAIALFVLAISALVACSPGSEAIPTVMRLPTITHTPVPTVVPPTMTPLVMTQPPVLPSATPIPITDTPTPSPEVPSVVIDHVHIFPSMLYTGWHINCQPQTALVNVQVTSHVPLQTVSLRWNYQGRITSQPGQTMEQIEPGEYELQLGPFREVGEIVYWVTAIDHEGNRTVSDQYPLIIDYCDEPTPTNTPVPGPQPTITPTYGEALSVHANDQTYTTEQGVAVQVVMTWRGGVSPFIVDQVTQPIHGTLVGVGPARTYIPETDFVGEDSFTFRVVDGNEQASRGTITIVVQPPE